MEMVEEEADGDKVWVWAWAGELLELVRASVCAGALVTEAGVECVPARLPVAGVGCCADFLRMLFSTGEPGAGGGAGVEGASELATVAVAG